MGKDNSVATFQGLMGSPEGYLTRRRKNFKKPSSLRPPTPFKKRRPGASNNFNEDDFDFAIVLSPSADYANVAEELDFEGDNVDHGMEEGVRLGRNVVLEEVRTERTRRDWIYDNCARNSAVRLASV